MYDIIAAVLLQQMNNYDSFCKINEIKRNISMSSLQGNKMKLYEVPRNTRIKVVGDKENTILLFHHIDGMYSYCTRDSLDELDQTPVHLVAWEEVEIV